MLDRKRLAETVKSAADKAGALVAVSLGAALAALLLAAAAFIMVLKIRKVSRA